MNKIALFTMHVLVNTDDLGATMEQLLERVETHETVTDVTTVLSKACPTLVRTVEEGTYKPGEMTNHYTFTEYTPTGESVFTNTVSPS